MKKFIFSLLIGLVLILSLSAATWYGNDLVRVSAPSDANLFYLEGRTQQVCTSYEHVLGNFNRTTLYVWTDMGQVICYYRASGANYYYLNTYFPYSPTYGWLVLR